MLRSVRVSSIMTSYRGYGGGRGRGGSQRQACFSFLKGECNRGDACRFSHSTRGPFGGFSSRGRGHNRGFGTSFSNPNQTNGNQLQGDDRRKLDRTGRKAVRREAQLRSLEAKASRDDEAYMSELRRFRSVSKQCMGFVPLSFRKQRTSEAELFRKQGSAGINFDKYNDIKVETSGHLAEEFSPMSSFADLKLQHNSSNSNSDIPGFLRRNIQLMNYEKPTPIQSHALPIALKQRDLMCCAQTGSGKTFAFLLPVVLSLSKTLNQNGEKKWVDNFEGDSSAPSALVLAPTRELAIQIGIEAEKLCNGSNIHSCVVYGGANAKGQLCELAKGMDLLVATPGRLQDFVDRDLVSLRRIQFLILDEADRMLDMGFEPQIRKLVQKSGMPKPGAKQTLMFSATFPGPMQKLASEFLHQYIWVGVGRVGSTVTTIEQRLVLATNNKRAKLDLLKQALLSADKGARTLVFVKKKHTARWVSKQLCMRHEHGGGFEVTSAEIHGDRSQAQREAALSSFREGRVQVLVATDVAARGLDIDGVEHVINFDLGSTADEFDSYVHRIGRTGRAGNTGLATSFYVPGYEPQSGSGPVAQSLLKLLHESKQKVPEWFMALPEVSGGGGGGKKSSKFGGRDVRGQTPSAIKRPKNGFQKVNLQQPSKRQHQHQRQSRSDNSNSQGANGVTGRGTRGTRGRGTGRGRGRTRGGT
mmetsp:Transcript_20788/g.25181  ORF Transcript_20788/g.25181 Transcript_20788/m.25181 type:complete len:699 (+) Transcript_20788:114-2210(+)